MEDQENSGLNFYYNRQKRLENAPKNVQDYYNGTMKMPPKGLFRMLFYQRSSRIVFVVLVFALVLSLFITFTARLSNSGTVSGINAELNAFSYDDSVYISLMFSPPKKKNSSFSGTVSAEICGLDKEKNVIQKENLSGFYDGEELFLRTIFQDYDIIQVTAEIYTTDSQKKLEAAVSKN